MPNISMRLSANYVTQSKLFSGNLVGKPLTDRRIRYYQLRGRYGPDMAKLVQAKKPTRKQQTLDALLKSFT